MPTRLDQIIQAARRRVLAAKKSADIRALEQQAQSHIPRGFRKKIKAASEFGIAVIAELKKASPSRGVIRTNFDCEGLARELEAAGAAALSVLTDQEFFQGSLENLSIASRNTGLPCLRKDFIVDEFQLLETRVHGGDAALLILAALSPLESIRLTRAARSNFGLDVLCEVHDETELKRAVDLGCDLIGVNNRDLRTFEVDLNTAVRLAKSIPKGAAKVAESGIHSGADIARLRNAGYDAFLIGESLMAAESPGQALRTLLLEAAAPVRIP